MRRFMCAAAGVLAATGATPAQEQPDSQPRVRFGAFVDTYWAWDFHRPRTLDREYTTQPARHNEFNVNLAHVEASVTSDRVRGRLALQAGTSVHSNYAGEPTLGGVSGSGLARHIQEAIVGVRLSEGVWLDGGVYLSHIGSEGWVSRDNLTYTRSLIADYSPYYQSGARVTIALAPTVTAQVNLVNGWQIISETNGAKSVGVRLDWQVAPRLTASYYNLIGNEQPDGAPSRWRVFQGVTSRYAPTERLTLLGTIDVGTQEGGATRSNWYGLAGIVRQRVTTSTALALRAERYVDPDRLIVPPGANSDRFAANGASIGLDVTRAPGVLWRTEWRMLSASHRVFTSRRGTADWSAVLVTSLALTVP